jgi:hypothetical protein
MPERLNADYESLSTDLFASSIFKIEIECREFVCSIADSST